MCSTAPNIGKTLSRGLKANLHCTLATRSAYKCFIENVKFVKLILFTKKIYKCYTVMFMIKLVIIIIH